MRNGKRQTRDHCPLLNRRESQSATPPLPLSNTLPPGAGRGGLAWGAVGGNPALAARRAAESMCRPPLATRLASFLLITSETSISLHEG